MIQGSGYGDWSLFSLVAWGLLDATYLHFMHVARLPFCLLGAGFLVSGHLFFDGRMFALLAGVLVFRTLFRFTTWRIDMWDGWK